jgi:hypothetical protein
MEKLGGRCDRLGRILAGDDVWESGREMAIAWGNTVQLSISLFSLCSLRLCGSLKKRF